MKIEIAFTSVSVLFFCIFVNIGRVKYYQPEKGQLKSTSQLYDITGNFIQEKSKYQYLGAEKCASVCHNNDKMGFQYNSWKSSPHSKAFDALSSKKAIKYAKGVRLKENPQESLACLKCHVTGAGLDTSFLTPTCKKEDGVSCEACHKQKFNPKTFLPKETDCLDCHNSSSHKVHKFDFSKDCKKIAHPRPKNPEK